MTTSADLLDKAFHAIVTRMVQTGRAPDHIELAAGLGLASPGSPIRYSLKSWLPIPKPRKPQETQPENPRPPIRY